MTLRDALKIALTYLDRVDESGNIDAYSAEYEAKAIDAANFILPELLKAERNDNNFVIFTSLEDIVPLSLDVSVRVLPFGIAFHLAYIDGDIKNYNYLYGQYENQKKMIICKEEEIVDFVNKLDGLRR